MEKSKIQNKIQSFSLELEGIETKIRATIDDPINTNYSSVGRLCRKIDVTINQVAERSYTSTRIAISHYIAQHFPVFCQFALRHYPKFQQNARMKIEC
jgi:hypothetical protein